MNGLHEQNHKRTSINELLNPVANGPAAAASLEGPYTQAQLGGMANPPYASAPRVPAAASSYHSPLGVPGSSFSLRAASWDRSGGNENDLGRREDGEPSSSCRYASANPSPHHAHPPPHPVYADPYHRSRPVGEPANYGIDVSPWTPNAHSPYSAQILAPIYSDDRTGAFASLCHFVQHNLTAVPTSRCRGPKACVALSLTRAR
jgi:[histone H3]-dimethyl-L-lysine9 demethylase